jgi:lipopolysaccharide/colanic/teichoic acid biosynthesis glycosyltransferase
MGITVETSQAKELRSPELTSAPVPATHPLDIASAYRRAHRNIRRHWLRDATRLSFLVAADLATYIVLRQVVRAVREGLLGPAAADLVTTLFGEGFLAGYQFAVALVLSLFIAGAYGAGDRRRDTGRVLAGVALAALIVLYQFAWQRPLVLVAVQFAATVIVVGSVFVIVRTLVDLAARRIRKNRPASRAILVMHDGADTEGVQDALGGIRELAVVDTIRLGARSNGDLSKELAQLATVIGRERADTVLLPTDLTAEEFTWAVDVALASGCRLLAGPRTPQAAGIQPRSVWIEGRPMVELTAPSLQAWQLAVKRVIDVVGSAIGLIVLSPLLLGISIWIKLDSPGPVLFSQTRVGARGRTFRMRKFRSMRSDAEELLRTNPELNRLFRENGFKIPAESDPRLSRAGFFLRGTSLDELPQLLNVLAGSMSLVGPRPVEPVELEHAGHHYGTQGLPVFLSAKPGMTGAWAVNGRSSVGYPERAQMELEYIRRWSITSDLFILFRTLPAIVSRRGAH